MRGAEWGSARGCRLPLPGDPDTSDFQEVPPALRRGAGWWGPVIENNRWAASKAEGEPTKQGHMVMSQPL